LDFCQTILKISKAIDKQVKERKEKKIWANLETKGNTKPTAEDKNTKNVSNRSHFLNLTLREFL
jgi:hypothetical protein